MYTMLSTILSGGRIQTLIREERWWRYSRGKLTPYTGLYTWWPTDFRFEMRKPRSCFGLTSKPKSVGRQVHSPIPFSLSLMLVLFFTSIYEGPSYTAHMSD